jgi:TPR repeat protein
METSCASREALACSDLGHIYGRGEGVPKDYEKAGIFWTKACNSGLGEACGNVAVLYAHGWGVQKNAAQASVLFARACDLGHTSDCKLARRYGKE